MSWSELRVEDKEHEVVLNGVTVHIPIEIQKSAKMVCGHCGEDMEWSYSADSYGDMTFVPICICMGGYDGSEG